MFKRKKKKSQIIKAKKDRDTIRFSGRKHSKKGIISTVIGIMVIICFITLSIISGVNHGNGSMILGVLGLVMLALSIYGCYLSYESLKERDIFYRFPLIGMVSNGVLVLLLLVLYILGI